VSFSWFLLLLAGTPERKVAATTSLVCIVILSFVTVQAVFFDTNKPVNKSLNPTAAVETTKKPAAVISEHQSLSKVSLQQHPAKKQRIVVGKGNFYVQVGAFKQTKLAHAMYKKMQRKYKYTRIVSQSNIHMIWVGPVATKAEALLLKTNIHKQYGIKGFITTKQ